MSGWLGFLALQWVRFGKPLASVSTEDAPGWGHGFAWHTLFKREAIQLVPNLGLHFNQIRVVLGAAATITVLALLPAVRRRFGNAYCAYVTLAILLPLIVSPDFVGMPRYLLAAFPCFAVVGASLERRPRVGIGVCAASGAGLMGLTSLFALGTYLS